MIVLGTACSTLPSGVPQAASAKGENDPAAGLATGAAGQSAHPVPAAAAVTGTDLDGIPAIPPAPVPDHADLWDRIRAGFALPPLDTPLVEEKERFYLRHPASLQRMFERGGRYLFYIVEQVEERGLPTELALLPFVESAMNPEAISSARAAGLWQFIPSTGRAYDLRQDWWVDDRRDIVKSTGAALDYLEKIHALAGNDWFLALASYNRGENAIARAIRRNQARGLPTDYLSLDLPAETRNYVPKLLALKNIILDAGSAGIELPTLPDEPYFVMVDETPPMDLALAARFAGMSVDEFVTLNPAHNRPVIAAAGTHRIKLPADRLERFLDAMERHRKANRTFASWQPYTLQQGETLASVARAAGTTEAKLLAANDLRPGRRLLAGTRLLVPQAGIEDESLLAGFDGPRVVELTHGPASHYRVRRGDTLTSIARRFGTSVAQLRTWNRLGPVLRTGSTLKVGDGAAQIVLTTANGAQRIVRGGETGIRPAVLTRPKSVALPAIASHGETGGTTAGTATGSKAAANTITRTSVPESVERQAIATAGARADTAAKKRVTGDPANIRANRTGVAAASGAARVTPGAAAGARPVSGRILAKKTI